MKEYIEKLRDVLYRFRDLYCQNVDLSTIDEFLEESTSPSIDLSGVTKDEIEQIILKWCESATDNKADGVLFKFAAEEISQSGQQAGVSKPVWVRELLCNFLKFIGKQDKSGLFVEVDGTVWRNAFAGGEEVHVVDLFIHENQKQTQKQLITEIMQEDEKDGLYEAPEPVEEIKKFVQELKNDAMKVYPELDNEEAKAVYACQNMICGMILKKIESL